MMLGIMRADQNDVESRKKQGYNQDIIPKKIDLDENEEKANEEKTQDEEVKNEKKSKEE
ncbi:MAG: Unknown protein [uncultured Sulfurovum sp.]|uniref:Uncharacterized protein n=1 Tax=uncultured Sulfurovum sp. TaxID=269237 RepID=A0A6S6SK85_9BACT|nr:MAG: Unknown protein [uncultured Sulfurovum sp.]